MLLVVCRASCPSIMVWGLISLQPKRASDYSQGKHR